MKNAAKVGLFVVNESFSHFSAMQQICSAIIDAPLPRLRF